MAITWIDGPKAGQAHYAGATLAIYGRTVRVMSDVWENETVAEVWTGSEVRILPLREHYWYRPAVQGEGRWLESHEAGCEWMYVTASASEDATPEVMAAAASWNAVNAIIERTRAIRDLSCQIRMQSEVLVHNGRKVPIGTLAEVTRIGQTEWGRTAQLRTADGKMYSYVAVGNIRLADQRRDFHGICGDDKVACTDCRTVGTAAELELELTCRCRACQLKATIGGRSHLALPMKAFDPDHDAFTAKPLPADVPFLERISATPDDMELWGIWCDFLEERGDERAAELRYALNGPTKKMRKKKAASV